MPRHDDNRPTFDQFAAIRRYQSALAFSPDGAEVAYSTNTSGQFNLWRQPSAGGYPRQLTLYADEAVRDVAWSPDGSTILYTADREGNEFYRPHLIPTRGGRPEPFPSAPEVQHYLGGYGAWSPDGRWIAYAGNDREATDQDVILRDATTGELKRVLAGDGSFFPIAWSPDAAFLTAVEPLSNTRYHLHLISVADGAARRLTADDADAQFYPGPWASDGSGFWLLTDEGREYIGLAFYDLAKNSYEWIETPDWDIEQLDGSKDGRLLVWSVNEDGISRLHARDTASGQPVFLPEIPRGVIGLLTVSPDGSKIGLLLNRATHPAEVFVLDLRQSTTTPITDGFLGGLEEADLIEPELIRFPTFDGKQIPGWLYRPQGDGPFPAVLSIHGGPEYQERPNYSYLYQYLLSRGIAVLAPNIRGSTGFGKSYQKLIHRDFGGGDLKDMEAAVQYLGALPWVDPKRIGVFGGSYGGFAVLSCVSRLPDYWAAAVDIVGPSNLVTFAKAVPPTWRRFMADWVGDPYTEADFLLERSPITYVDQITAPLFVIQGANDPRVVKPESDQIVERLRARSVEVRYDVYEDEGHGFTKRANELKAYRDTCEFFEQYLLN
ncbi:MAG: prolyl oligopeptidase family serine peptidase [Thermomicrobiales bacterium]